MRPGPAGSAGRWGGWIALAALTLWAAAPHGWLLGLAATGAVATVVTHEHRSRTGAAGLVLLLAGILAGFVAHRQVSSVTRDFEAYWSGREGEVEKLLAARLERRLQDAEAAADGLASLVARGTDDWSDELAQLRRRTGVTALALYGPAGELRAWDGVHRGRVPEEVQRGLRRYAYASLPLFGYVYVTSPAGGAGTAIAAILLRTDLPEQLAADAGDFASAFRAETGEGVRIVSGDADGGVDGWDFRLGNRVLFTVVLDPPTVADRSGAISGRWRARVALIALLAWVLLAAAGAAQGGGTLAAAGVLLLMAATLPFQEIAALEPLFRALPRDGPTLSVGRWAAMAVAAGTFAPMALRWRGALSASWIAALAAVALPAVGWLAERWAMAAPVDAGDGVWVLYQGALVGSIALVTVALLGSARTDRARAHFGGFAVALALVLGLCAGAWVWRRAELAPAWFAVWALPVGLLALGTSRGEAWWRRPAAWVAIAAIAGTASIPAAWAHRLGARLRVGESYLERLAAPSDPEVEDALERLGAAALRYAGDGERGVELLYAAWHESGLAELGQPAWLTVWSPAGIPQVGLKVGMNTLPAVARDVQAESDERAVSIRRYERDDARYVLRVALPDGDVLTGTVPPFPDPSARFPLSPLLAGRSSDERPLTLIPLGVDEDDGGPEVRWVRSERGWQGELPLRFPNEVRYHAHYAVQVPGPTLAVARFTLLLLLDVAVLLLVAIVGWALRREVLAPELRWSGLVVSFRARVTLALFGFFVLANAIFGTLAYRTIAGASHRAAQVLAERVVDDAAASYYEVGGRMQALSRRGGVELLEYRGGELRDGSVEELVDLGLYEGWLPYRVQRVLDGGEGLLGFSEGALGPWSYVTAYRRLPDGDVLAAQVPLQAGASAIRSTDVAELLGFAVVVGAALSLALALLVGRALTSPIHALRIASERVGAGNLGLRLPADREDEFGAVFSAFNRMVGRLRRARRQLVRTSRRTQAIMDEAAVGMVAVDAEGRVTLVNPRAVGLLEMALAVGEPIGAEGAAAGELRAWLDGFLARGSREATFEIARGSRRIRVRARRLGADAGDGGAVVALEDVTDELRTERVLAWGEMARQVAHEVKNPLTPIKLSVQHLRRAWDDRNPDFERILTRNADAMLAEIDRLAGIAKSFSRFGAPSGPGEAPLEAVDVGRVVADIMALYAGSHGPVTFVPSVAEGIPAARARTAEVKEVLVNLLENARAAARDGGVVRVEAGVDDAGDVLLRVVDDGSGIPPELLGRVFEPHFSSRTTGTGLGLAIVRRLVESWGGDVTLGSEPGLGTAVTMRLRRWSDAAPRTER